MLKFRPFDAKQSNEKLTIRLFHLFFLKDWKVPIFGYFLHLPSTQLVAIYFFRLTMILSRKRCIYFTWNDDMTLNNTDLITTLPILCRHQTKYWPANHTKMLWLLLNFGDFCFSISVQQSVDSYSKHTSFNGTTKTGNVLKKNVWSF